MSIAHRFSSQLTSGIGDRGDVRTGQPVQLRGVGPNSLSSRALSGLVRTTSRRVGRIIAT